MVERSPKTCDHWEGKRRTEKYKNAFRYSVVDKQVDTFSVIMYAQLTWVLLAGSAALAFPQLDLTNSRQPQYAKIISLQNDADNVGAFSYSYETENGIKAEARGTLNNAGVPDAEEQVVTGSFSFVGDNGQLYSVSYIADANGFRAFGDHLPPSPYAVDAKLRVSPPSTATSPAPAPTSPATPNLHSEQDALEQWQQLSDIRGLTPPPPPSHQPTDDPYSAGLVLIPTARSRRQRQHNFY